MHSEIADPDGERKSHGPTGRERNRPSAKLAAGRPAPAIARLLAKPLWPKHMIVTCRRSAVLEKSRFAMSGALSAQSALAALSASDERQDRRTQFGEPSQFRTQFGTFSL